ncbi:MAG: class I tRNA ligase family protein, partial [Spirochaetaceae bacterium]|nr:class I tRNA ligase family protein [Spirochaetaceae bacterium]
WNDLCDWYLEASKLYLYSDNQAEKNRAVTQLIGLLEESMRMLHPFLSFLTEEIYQKLPGVDGPLITAAYPVVQSDRENPELDKNFDLLKDLVQKIRTLRSEFTIPPSKKIKVAVHCDKSMETFLQSETELIASLVKAEELEISHDMIQHTGAVKAVGKGYQAYAFIRDLIDVDKEIARMEKAIEKNDKLKKQTQGKLKNERFVSNAPAEVVEKEKEKLAEFEEVIQKMSAYLAELQG